MKIYRRWQDLLLTLHSNPQKKRAIKQKNKYAFIFFALSMLVYSSCYAGTNTGLYGDDKYAGPFPVGFAFNYYGNNFSQFYVTTNGLVQFSNPTTAFRNYCLPASFNNTLYVFWDDLRTDVYGQPTGTIQYETQGEAPNRKLIVQWTNQYFFGSNLPMGTFQTILYEGSNQIKYQYRYLVDDRSKGNSATIGIQGTTSNYAQIGCNTANTVKPEQAILFTPNSDFSHYSIDRDAPYHFIDISGLTPDAPLPTARYSNQAPIWSWQKVSTLNTYEIDIQDPTGNSVYSEVLGDVNRYTYVDGLQNGLSYRARIRGSINQGGTWEAWSELSSLVTIDTIKPTVELKQFIRLTDDTVKIAFNVNDNLSGVEVGHLQIANNANFETPIIDQDITINSNSYQISGVSAQGALYARLAVTDRAGNDSGYTRPLAITVLPPVLINPVSKQIVKTSTLHVQGRAETAGKVQLYLNSKALGAPVKVDADGYFFQNIELGTEGNYQLTAALSNEFGASEPSKPILFSFALPIPTAVITTPASHQAVLAPVDIQVSATDELGIAKVDIYIDDQPFATLTELSYQMHWPLTIHDNGDHMLTVKATNISGKVTTVQRIVTVKIEPPAPPPTIYTGRVSSVNPSVSYGEQPITIIGQAIYRGDGSVVANAPVKLVLTVNGFERKITTATDDKGKFHYIFTPQESDSGIYQVAIIHPDELTTTAQASFIIDRIAFNLQGYNLKAPRNITTPISVKATASNGAKNLRWVFAAENQPDGILPKGIQINSEVVNIGVGDTKQTVINFTADNTAAETGSIYLVALSDDSAALVRGKLQVNYQLGQAMPTLYAIPSYIQTGLQQGTTTSANINIGNKGLINAENVQIQLVDENGHAAPSWVFIAANTSIGSIAVDEQVPVQIIAQPDNRVADGVYDFNIKLSANNNISGAIPVSISVTQSGQGIAQFDVADIYTATLNEQSKLIPGVKGATIKLQNEAVLTQEYTITSNEQGIALLENIPTGIYRYRVSAANHMDVSGRIVIRPNTTTNEHIFLEYQTINIEFGVTETTIQDIYDITLNATFNTQVPAPVVLLEPLSINLAGMVPGEEKIGQLTVTNYGLVQAKNVVLTLPKTDAKFKYEFFGELPSVLLPKQKIVIPYRVTALAVNKIESIEPKTAAQVSLFGMTSANEECISYSTNYPISYEGECANGDITKGNTNGYFYLYTGKCSLNGPAWEWGGSFGDGYSGGSGLGSPSPMPITPGCSPQASCASGGASNGAK
ncbi:Ig-like domain-containing protein [Orbus sturtevantii]|uniref:Ig-like domain-containing protein n=1 Tax=Orbus sturtevantii TaxID=3074109 RepID=UPI00370D8DDA